MKNRLFLPITIKGKEIKNRVVMPPMVCFSKSETDGLVTDFHVDHYRKRAEGGTGLIIVEATAISPEGRLSHDQLGIWEDGQIEGLAKIADACHEHGAVVLLQIHHGGLKSSPVVTDLMLAPSVSDEIPSKELSLEEIEDIKDKFLKAAKRAHRAGFDGVEIHGAHGYLINQFVSPNTNKRTDKYGGSFKNHIRLPFEIVRSIRDEFLDKNFIIGYRMGGNEPKLKDGVKIAKELECAGVDLLHVSAGIGCPNEHLPKPPKGFPFSWIVYAGTKIKKHISIPVIAVNGLRTSGEAALLIENRLADFAAIGHGHLVDPEWTKKALHQLEHVECLECEPRCFWYDDGDLCPQNQD